MKPCLRRGREGLIGNRYGTGKAHTLRDGGLEECFVRSCQSCKTRKLHFHYKSRENLSAGKKWCMYRFRGSREMAYIALYVTSLKYTQRILCHFQFLKHYIYLKTYSCQRSCTTRTLLWTSPALFAQQQ